MSWRSSAEWHGYRPEIRRRYTALVDSPNLADPAANRLRRELLWANRKSLLCHIPKQCRWYEVRNLKTEHIQNLYAINHRAFRAAGHNNELTKVAALMPQPLCREIGDWPNPVLWGHGKEGPFTVIEGNHRLIAHAALPGNIEFAIPVYVGLSQAICRLHLPDLF